MKEAELNCLVFLMYAISTLFALQFVAALYNSWAFLLKQGKYRMRPLLIFYLLTVLLCIIRIYYTMWLLAEVSTEVIVGFLLPPLIKINMGIHLCWSMLELSLRIRQSIKVTELMSDPRSSLRIQTADPTKGRTEKVIQYGRQFLTVFVLGNLLALIIYFMIEQCLLSESQRHHFIRSWLDVIVVLLYVQFTMLALIMIWLIRLIKRKRDQVQLSELQQAVYDKEILTLRIILGVFSASYLVRALWDTFYDPRSTTFGSLSGAIALGIVFDFFPVMLLILLHYRNFRP